MNIFLSWSGERSKALAEALRDYLPLVIQQIKNPWFSPDDIEKGSRWLQELSDRLATDGIAIICLTSESLSSPWLLFEAGALSKSLEASWVCPVLLGIEPSDIRGPLAQFQTTKLTFEDTRKLLGTLNRRLSDPVPEQLIDRLHQVLWPSLKSKIDAIPKTPANVNPVHRTEKELISEVLERIRGLERKVETVHAETNVQLNYTLPKSRAHDRQSRPVRLSNRWTLKTKIDHFKTLLQEAKTRVSGLQAALQVPDLDSSQVRELDRMLKNEQRRMAQLATDVQRHEVKFGRQQEMERPD